MMRPNDGAVDHLNLAGSRATVVESIENQVPQACQRPAPELAIDARPFAELLRQVPPLRSSARNPEYPVQHKPMVRRRPAATPPNGNDERLKKRPFSVFHQQSSQDSLLRKLS
jgi:hypothetical protein